jgi:uncharacterized membrane protein YeaQ/YmgE (transglycosylase-associated protein family)
MDVDSLGNYINFLLAWIGFGMVLGLVALIAMPSADGRGSLATVLMATAGSLCGCILLQQLSYTDQWVLPISTQGFTVGIGGAAVMLIFFRVLGGQWLPASQTGFFRHHRRRRRRHLITDQDDRL